MRRRRATPRAITSHSSAQRVQHSLRSDKRKSNCTLSAGLTTRPSEWPSICLRNHPPLNQRVYRNLCTLRRCWAPPHVSPLLETIFRNVAAIAVIFVRQEFSRHRDFDAVAVRIGEALYHHVESDRRHDAVAELLLDQRLPRRTVDHHKLIETVDQRIGWRHQHALAPLRRLVEHRDF